MGSLCVGIKQRRANVSNESDECDIKMRIKKKFGAEKNDDRMGAVCSVDESNGKITNRQRRLTRGVD